MSLFDALFKKTPKPQGQYGGMFKLLNGYVPQFTTYQGGVYESELIRAAINARAVHMGKLKIEIKGSAKPALRVKLQHAPNRFQSWSQFMYRLSTILDVNNTAFITPIYDEYGEVSGIYAPLPQRCEIVQYNDIPYLRYTFSNGDRASIELENCGIMTKFQYSNDMFGENNNALLPTMDLVHIQNQGIKEGVKSAATYRFWAQ
ncbi:MAG: phage portal protein, partial [Clostridiales bacterium]|nr:phage portal protein [Clostridiales bacterium]